VEITKNNVKLEMKVVDNSVEVLFWILEKILDSNIVFPILTKNKFSLMCEHNGEFYEIIVKKMFIHKKKRLK
jgi:hypothetical protein